MCQGFIAKDTRAGSWFGLHNLGITLGARSSQLQIVPSRRPRSCGACPQAAEFWLDEEMGRGRLVRRVAGLCGYDGYGGLGAGGWSRGCASGWRSLGCCLV